MKRIVFTLLLLVLSSMGMAQREDGFEPNKYTGSSMPQIFENASSYFGHFSFLAGVHMGQYLNPSYGLLSENKDMKSFGASFGIMFAFYPVMFDYELSYHSNTFQNGGEKTISNTEKADAGYLSIALFPWTYRSSNIVIPVVGIGFQKSTLHPNWGFSSSEEVLDDVVNMQPVIKMGLIINIPLHREGMSFLLRGNYYRSLFVKEHPHAFNAFSISLGMSKHY